MHGRRTAAGLLLLVSASVLHEAAALQQPAVLNPGDTLVVESGEEGAPVQSPGLEANPGMQAVGRTYQLAITEPGTYRVEMRSPFFDSYLVLRGSNGNVLAEDDNGLFGGHARIVFEASPEREKLVVEACAIGDMLGPFVLTLAAGAPPVLTPHERSAEMIEDAQRTLAAREAVFGAGSLQVGFALHDLAWLLSRAGRRGEALPLCEASLRTFAVSLGPDADLTVTQQTELAELLMTLDQLDRSAYLYEQALASARTRLRTDHPFIARNLGGLAGVRLRQGALDEARALADQAVAIYQSSTGADSPELGLMLIRLGDVLLLQGDGAGSRAAYERALEILDRHAESVGCDVIDGILPLARALERDHEFAAARSLFERALAQTEECFGSDHPNVAAIVSSLAVLASEQGDYPAARALGERAVACCERGAEADPVVCATRLGMLATIMTLQGDFSDARPLFERAVAIDEAAKGPEAAELGQILHNYAGLLSSQGDRAGALSLYARALGIRERTAPDSADLASTLSNLATELAEDREYDAARPLFARALAIQEELFGPDSPEVAPSLGGMIMDRLAVNDFEGARPVCERMLALLDRESPPDVPILATALCNLAFVLKNLGDESAARPLYERAVSLRASLLGVGHPDVETDLLDLALVHLDLGDVAAATAILEQSGGHRAAFLSTLLLGFSQRDVVNVVALYRSIIALALSPVMTSGRAIGACEDLLAWKGQVLRIAQSRRALRPERLGPDGRQLVGRLRDVSAALSRSATRAGRDLGPVDGASLEGLMEERQRLERELSMRVAGRIPPTPTWTEVRDALPAGSALVDVFVHSNYEPARRDGDELIEKGHWTERQITAWITVPNASAPIRVDLGLESIIETAVHVPWALPEEARGTTSFDSASAGADFRRLVWDKLVPHLAGVQTVFVSPDRAFGTIPFEILKEDDGRYLVESRAFVYLTDPTLIVRSGSMSRRPHDSLVVMGGVDYGAIPDGNMPSPATLPVPTEEDATVRGFRRKDWLPLQHTAAEVRSVSDRHAAAFPDGRFALLIDGHGTEEVLKSALTQMTAAHLATHGYFNDEGLPSLETAATEAIDAQRGDRPRALEAFTDVTHRLQGYSPGLLSGIVCAGANAALPSDHEDGYFTAEEVGWLDLSRLDLVVLSACDTGLGRALSGEGLIGLRRAFLEAGAHTVICSLWSVPDQETAELMDLFYANLWERKLGKHESLRAAQLEMIRRNRERFGGDARPVTWGAFVLDGDWR